MFTGTVVVAVVITGFAVLLLLPICAPCSWGWAGLWEGVRVSNLAASPLPIPCMPPHLIHALWKAAWLSEWGAFLLHPIRTTLMMSSVGGGWKGIPISFDLLSPLLSSWNQRPDLWSQRFSWLRMWSWAGYSPFWGHRFVPEN